MSAADWQAVILTLKLALLTTVTLMLIGPMLAWWLARKRSFIASCVEAVVALPLVLPPTVLGFYLLWAFSPVNGFGALWLQWFGSPLVFSFTGLWFASIIYSLPFVVQPLQAAFSNLGKDYLEAAATMGMGGTERFFRIVVPLTLPSFVIAAVLGFAHTVGEFGVVLMIGGNIAGETRVLSIALFDHVEMLDFNAAHRLAGLLLIFSIAVLVLVYGLMKRRQQRLLPCS
ncbi:MULTISPECIES: molybdate ABC transporter permease subunit [Corallincola]|uniref:Molybdenum transport system permease n=2 Tax=Corallincola TaxID=1775176 RepID=A0A368NPR5_9GAMM|nr:MULTISPECIES: molybdate ABC transporter permease subunit [Corallincola]RCU52557.1 molybdate ABC transporter permease subunit [Corallincola holothuriorum]TAA48251.1 molybdate ABC transporter permease subunit [Corallincola spongiicola]